LPSLIEDALAKGAEQLVGGDHEGVLMPAPCHRQGRRRA
jgi:hypothetical protein